MRSGADLIFSWLSRGICVSSALAVSSVTEDTAFGFCTFRDHQRINIQEMPERATAGQLPRSIDVILDGDLVNKCKPGDRVQVVVIYRSMGGGRSGTFKYAPPYFCPGRALVLANNNNLLSSKAGGGIGQTPLTSTDIRQINQLSKINNIFNPLAMSLAPSIFGHKESVAASVGRGEEEFTDWKKFEAPLQPCGKNREHCPCVSSPSLFLSSSSSPSLSRPSPSLSPLFLPMLTSHNRRCWSA
ncbi:nucleic acid-binding protein [Schizopora paradoxa]|uniref:DNA replication licensing factor MCM3 n=1 Tax=Schizopora paradoxa TaxID=27342 RepID=A0A0H2RJP0_9AGAM|nr:nucleic acid-binding protein [Schizopora paradoxa]